MILTPRIIAIDDNSKHLEVLVQGLNRCGTACLPIHFEGEEVSIKPCFNVRLIFADLNLISGGSLGGENHSQDFNLIASLIEERIKPSGPYLIVLWTRYPDQAQELYGLLMKRLKTVAKPFTVKALDKAKYLDLKSDEVEANQLEDLVRNIEKSIEDHPQFGALLNWEERVLDGAADTLSSIMEMASSHPAKTCPALVLGKLLRILAEGAVGKRHVEDDRFRAVNDALLPILADRLASMRSQNSDNQLWKNALVETDEDELPMKQKARLNNLLHIAPPTANNAGERGAVIKLLEEFIDESFIATFGIQPEMAMTDQFRCKQPKGDESGHWVLVQTQATCDYAQNQPGPLPFHLGLLMPKSSVITNKKPPAALWCSPCFEHDQQVQCLHVSARFPVSLLKEKARRLSPLFRLREQLLNNLIYHLHSYGARPGFISFR